MQEQKLFFYTYTVYVDPEACGKKYEGWVENFHFVPWNAEKIWKKTQTKIKTKLALTQWPWEVQENLTPEFPDPVWPCQTPWALSPDWPDDPEATMVKWTLTSTSTIVMDRHSVALANWLLKFKRVLVLSVLSAMASYPDLTWQPVPSDDEIIPRISNNDNDSEDESDKEKEDKGQEKVQQEGEEEEQDDDEEDNEEDEEESHLSCSLSSISCRETDEESDCGNEEKEKDTKKRLLLGQEDQDNEDSDDSSQDDDDDEVSSPEKTKSGMKSETRRVRRKKKKNHLSLMW